MRGGRLVRVDRDTLSPSSRPQLRLRRYGYSQAISPDGTRLALGGFGGSVRIVDMKTLRPLADVRAAPARSLVSALTWGSRRRVVAVAGAPPGHRAQIRVIALDVISGRSRSRTLGCRCDVLHALPLGRGELLLLLAPPEGVGTVRLARVDSRGSTRLFTVPGIKGGFAAGAPDRRERAAVPGLAVDTDGERAFLVNGEAGAAEVDLRSGATSQHRIALSRSVVDRFRSWLQPAAAAKGAVGPRREAAWLGNGLIATAGYDIGSSWDTRSAGLHLVDTRSWTARPIDHRVSRLSAAGDIVLAYGGDPDEQAAGPGLAAFDRTGSLLWRRFEGAVIHSVQATGGRVYVDLPRRSERAFALDLRSGRTLHSLRSPVPRLVIP